ncbi:TPA: hypothetical protein ACTW9I_000677 [Raoultella planticola]
MKYYVYPSKEYIGDSVLLEVTKNDRGPDEYIFTEFECHDDCITIPSVARAKLNAVGYNTSKTVVAVID